MTTKKILAWSILGSLVLSFFGFAYWESGWSGVLLLIIILIVFSAIVWTTMELSA